MSIVVKMSSEDEISRLKNQVKVARDEIKNMRKAVEGLKRVHKKDSDNIRRLLTEHSGRREGESFQQTGVLASSSALSQTTSISNSLDCLRDMKPIGFMSSAFVDKNGTPRQPLVAESRGSLTISKEVFNNQAHSLQGLDKYSHVWILFAFHKNSSQSSSSSSSSSRFSKAKVHPPRLGGASLGVFACRSPHRPNPIGLTLAKIETIRNNVIELSAIDLIDGTPVLDLKPYISDYDQPSRKRPRVAQSGEDAANPQDVDRGDVTESSICTNSDPSRASLVEGFCHSNDSPSHMAEWLQTANEEDSKFQVIFSPTAVRGLTEAFPNIPTGVPKPESVVEAQRLVENVLREDPRSVYRKTKCRELLYFSSVCGLHVTSWFDDDNKVVNVLKIVVNDETCATLSSDKLGN